MRHDAAPGLVHSAPQHHHGRIMPLLPDLPQTEIAIVALTNAFRQENRLGAVAPSRELTAAARWFAQYLARTGKFAHEADGREPRQRAAAHGYNFCMVGENLALNLDSRGFTSEALASEAVEGWKASPPHRRTLLEPAVTEIGVAVARVPDKHPKFVSVQLFGRPETLKMVFEVRNTTPMAVSYTVAGETHAVAPRTSVTHTTCMPGQLSFTRAGSWLAGMTLDQHFMIGNDATFTILNAGDGRVSIQRDGGTPK